MYGISSQDLYEWYFSSSMESALFCRICHQGVESEALVKLCHCSGSIGLMHKSCVEKWLGMAGSDKCEICDYGFKTTRISKPLNEVSSQIYWRLNEVSSDIYDNHLMRSVLRYKFKEVPRYNNYFIMFMKSMNRYRICPWHYIEIKMSQRTIELLVIYMLWVVLNYAPGDDVCRMYVFPFQRYLWRNSHSLNMVFEFSTNVNIDVNFLWNFPH